MSTTEQQTLFTDPGLQYGVDIERATLFIGRAAEWPPASREQRIERNSLGWRIIRAYTRFSSDALEAMSEEMRYDFLLATEPALVFITPRPSWATKTNTDTVDTCGHELTLLNQGSCYVAIYQWDNLDDSGNIVTGKPEVFVSAGDTKEAWTPPALMDLAKALEAAAHHIARIRR